jgi:hypothetical protein
MHTIRTVNTQRFSLNGIEYLKNYVTNISGNLLEIFNCYDRCDVLLSLTHYNQFIVNGATYSTAAQLQAALADILYVRTTLGEVAADISQDNIDMVRKLRIPTLTITNVLNAINTGPAFTISDTQSVWFVVTVTAGGTAIPRGSVYKYKMTGLGKGDYGAPNGTNSPHNLALGNLELVYFNIPTASSIRLEPNTAVINFGILGQDATLFSWLNSRPANAPVNIQPAEEGLTIFEGTINGTATQRLWNGGSGKYGIGAQQAQEADFKILSDEPPNYEIPDYEMVLITGPKTTQYALHQEAGQENITGYGTRIFHSGIDGKISVEFENPTSDIVYTIPAKTQNDVFGMRSDVHKPVKVIATGDPLISDGLYKLEPDDFNYWLSFEMTDDFTVLIPKIFNTGMLIEGDVSGSGMARFKTDEDVLLRHSSSELPRTAERNSVFGIKFRKEDEALLFGKLELK